MPQPKFAHTFGNLNKMDQFLERHNLPKVTQEINYPNRPIAITLNQELIIFPNRKLQAQMSSLVNCIKHLRRNNTNSLQSLSEDRSKGLVPNTFYEASSTLIPKPDKNIARKENCRPMCLKETLLEDNRRKPLDDLGCGDHFLDTT